MSQRETTQGGELILRLLDEMGTAVKGRTMMQKIVFILRSKFGKFHDYLYTIHYYGPFSRDLADALDRLRLQGLIEETPVLTGDTVRYDITITDEGRTVARTGASSKVPLRDMVRVAHELNAAKLNDVIDEAYAIAAKGLD